MSLTWCINLPCICINLFFFFFFHHLSQTDDRVDSNWHRDQLQTERRDESQLRAELEESQKQLKCAHDAQQEQKNKTMSLRYVLPAQNTGT